MGMKVNGTSGLTFPDTTTLASAGQASVRAWVNFNGTGTVAIRAGYNVTSITDRGTGKYTVNFTTAMPDANYSAQGNGQKADTTDDGGWVAQVGGYVGGEQTASACPVVTGYKTSNTPVDGPAVFVAVFR